jgi:hypothetical protein
VAVCPRPLSGTPFGDEMETVIRILKPTVPKCVGAVLLAAAQYYGAALVFMFGITWKVLAEPATWTKLAEDFQKCGINAKDVSQVYARDILWLQVVFDLIVGYLVVAAMAEWTLRRRDGVERNGAPSSAGR